MIYFLHSSLKIFSSQYIKVLFLGVLVSGCMFVEEQKESLFILHEASNTGVDFKNMIDLFGEKNIYNYRNYYNGGGVAIADVNDDGYPDLFFTSNMGSNRLYLNQGNLRFIDVTKKAGISGQRDWSTGVTTLDVNHDGFIDFYIGASGENANRFNELFVHVGTQIEITVEGDTLNIPQYADQANQYGLDHDGMTIASTVLDIDRDGQLDLYIQNNEEKAIDSFDISQNERLENSKTGGDQLFKRVDNQYLNVTNSSGIYSSIIGFTLSATPSDINGDGFTDLFVANDFFERDYMYINQRDGTFKDIFQDQPAHHSMSVASMGSDIADINRDGLPDIYVADMLPREDKRLKSIPCCVSWENINDRIRWDYGYQITRNTLHINRGNESFSEVGRLAKVEASDWSWAVLMADYDLNGWTDIYITNGLLQDITNADYLKEVSTPEMVRSIVTQEGVDFMELIDIIPSVPIPNVMFSGKGDLEFEEIAREWGLGEPSFSSGAAWGDLDGDGDLDLVVNDLNGPARLYENRSTELHPERTWLRVDLKGSQTNTLAIGTKVTAYAEGEQWVREHFLQRGFQSSVEPGLFFGFGEVAKLDSLVVQWPNGSMSRWTNPEELLLPMRLSLEEPVSISQ
jgi:hypothetical protein